MFILVVDIVGRDVVKIGSNVVVNFTVDVDGIKVVNAESVVVVSCNDVVEEAVVLIRDVVKTTSVVVVKTGGKVVDSLVVDTQDSYELSKLS